MAAVGNHFERKVRFAIGGAAAHRRADAGRVGGINEIHVEADGDACRVVACKAQGFGHHFAHAALVDVAHRKNVHAGFLDQAAFFRIEIADADQRDIARLDHRSYAAQVGQFGRSIAHDRSERHAMNVAGRRGFRRVHIAVRVEPDHADALRLLAEMRGDAGRRADRDRMIAAENERQQVFVESFPDHFGEAFAGLGNFVEIFRVFLAVVLLFGLADRHIADIFHLAAQLFQARLQAGDAKGGRAHVHAAAAGAQVHRHTDDADFFSHAVLSFRDPGLAEWTLKDRRDRACVGRE